MADETTPTGDLGTEDGAAAAPRPKKYRKPPIAGQRVGSVGAELEMIGQLGDQAGEILRLAVSVQNDTFFANFSEYLSFREKISEFEAFCNVIESHLKEIVSDRRQELEDRFYSLWAMIFRPSLGALTRFFEHVADEEVLPLGGKDLVESEIRSLDSMRSVLAAPRFASIADKTMIAEIDRLEAVLETLAERATSLPDFSKRPPMQPRPEPAQPRSATQPAPKPEAVAAAMGDAPNVKAVRELKGLLDYFRRDKTLKQYVDIDTRAVDEIERKFIANPMDPAAIVWLRQICNAWASRLRDNDKEINRVLSMIRSS